MFVEWVSKPTWNRRHLTEFGEVRFSKESCVCWFKFHLSLFVTPQIEKNQRQPVMTDIKDAVLCH